jgi:subtilisin family serine protease
MTHFKIKSIVMSILLSISMTIVASQAASYEDDAFYIVSTVGLDGKKTFKRMKGSALNIQSKKSYNIRNEAQRYKNVIIEKDVRVSNPITSKPQINNNNIRTKHQSIQKKQSTSVIPNDEDFDNQAYFWGAPSAGYSSYPNELNSRVIEAYEIVKDLPSVRIGVIDGGFYEYEDLNVVDGWSFFDSKVEDDLGNIYKDEKGPVYYSDPDNSCEVGHGFGVAGVISALTNNRTGIAGLVKSDVVIARTLACGSGFISASANAIRWLSGAQVDDFTDEYNGVEQIQKVDVINISLGATAKCPKYIQDAIDFANSQNVIVVVAAGNQSMDSTMFTPANCDGVITVAASTPDGSMFSDSNQGDNVTITARGVSVPSYHRPTITGIYEEDGNQRLGYWDGTSFAAPHVAGVVGMLRQLNPEINKDEVVNALAEGVVKLPSVPICSEDGTCGTGLGLMDIGNTIFKYNSVLTNQYGTIDYALNDVENCNAESYVVNNDLLSRMCSLKNVSLTYDKSRQFESEPTFYIYQTPFGEAIDIDTAVVFHQSVGEETELTLADMDVVDYTYSYRVAVDGQFSNEELLPITSSGSVPEMCLP